MITIAISNVIWSCLDMYWDTGNIEFVKVANKLFNDYFDKDQKLIGKDKEIQAEIIECRKNWNEFAKSGEVWL